MQLFVLHSMRMLYVGKVYFAVCNLFLFKYSLNSAKLIFSVSFAIFSLISLNTFTLSKVFSFLFFVFVIYNFFW